MSEHKFIIGQVVRSIQSKKTYVVTALHAGDYYWGLHGFPGYTVRRSIDGQASGPRRLLAEVYLEANPDDTRPNARNEIEGDPT